MVFLDGVGIGGRDASRNPFLTAAVPHLVSLMGGEMVTARDSRRHTINSSVVPLNATLGVKGLPQSGTGQTALLTGINASRKMGRHFGPYPASTIRPILEAENIFSVLKQLGRRCLFANSFPQRYFDYFNAHKTRMAAFSSAWLASGGVLNDATALMEGKGLSADITSERWPELGYPDIPRITPQDAGKRLAILLETHDFVVYEHYFTDYAGHHQSMHDAHTVLNRVDDLIGGILSEFDPKRMLFLLTSDHGNIEDLSVKTHTRNPVPLITAGTRHRFIAEHSRSITDIVPILTSLLR
jgi:2,3-bisphosphoglycerate-independent phosphoglycerate mutase